MKKVNVLFFSLAILFLMSCGGGETASTDAAASDTAEDVELDLAETMANRFCECGADLPAVMEQFKAKEIDKDAYFAKMDAFEACIDPDGKMKELEAAMTPEDNKATKEKMDSIMEEKCPILAKEMAM